MVSLSLGFHVPHFAFTCSIELRTALSTLLRLENNLSQDRAIADLFHRDGQFHRIEY
jgi:hypothetical protein